MYKLTHINPLTATEQELIVLHDCANAIWQEEDGVTLGFKEFCEASKNIKKTSQQFDIYLLLNGEQAIGRLIFQIVQNHDDQDVAISILKEHLDSKVLRFLDEKITENYFEKMAWLKTFQPEIRQWAIGKGFELVNQFQHFEKILDSSQIPYLESIAVVPDDLSIHYLSYPEGKFLLEFTNFMNNCFKEMIRDKVRENLHMEVKHVADWVKSAKKRNMAFEIVALRDKQEKMVAMSFGVLSRDTPKYLQQRMTGVLNPHRGRKLGMASKSLLYLKVINEYPMIEAVKTDCFTTNKPMYDIQTEMGFQPTNIADELLRE